MYLHVALELDFLVLILQVVACGVMFLYLDNVQLNFEVLFIHLF